MQQDLADSSYFCDRRDRKISRILRVVRLKEVGRYVQGIRSMIRDNVFKNNILAFNVDGHFYLDHFHPLFRVTFLMK